jgi:hypothetical protein
MYTPTITASPSFNAILIALATGIGILVAVRCANFCVGSLREQQLLEAIAF